MLSSLKLRVPRDAGLVCHITWPLNRGYVMCFGCGWEMDRPSLQDIHDHVADPGFTRVLAERNTFAFLDEAGKYHRENGPAVVPKSESKPGIGEWYRHGLLHREDGPAVVSVPDMPSFHEWWFQGVQVFPDTSVDGYYEIHSALEAHEDASYLLPQLDAMLSRAMLDGLVRGGQIHRVD